MHSLIAAIRFLTRIPMPGRDSTVHDISIAVGWFPLVGALVGGVTAGIFCIASKLWNPSIAAVLAVAGGLMLTGGFHEDGATDAVDGLGGGWTRERVLEIMKDSRIGAYGAMALWCLLMFRWGTLVTLGPQALLVLPLAMAWGRASIALVLVLLPPIGTGLAKEVHRGLGKGPLLLSLMLASIAGICAWRLGLPRVGWSALASLCMCLVWTLYLKRRMGGHSGDLLGAGNQWVEAAVLLVMMMK